MNYKVRYAPLHEISSIQRGVVNTDTAEQARNIFVLAGCEVYEVEEIHAVEQATALEALPESEQVAAEVENDSRWLDSASERDDSYSIPLSDIERHNAHVKPLTFSHDPNCKHEKAFPTHGGMMCRCGAKFEARNEFEQRLVNSRNPKGNGYVNYQFR